MITILSIAITATYLLLDKYLPLLMSRQPQRRSLFGWRMRTDP
jgi:hypothetical protein